MPRTKKTASKSAAPKTKKSASKKVRASDGRSVGRPFAKRPPVGIDTSEEAGYFGLTSPNAITRVPAETWTAFLKCLAETGHVKDSCAAVGLNRITAYTRKTQDEEFAAEWEKAHAIGFSVLEDEAKRRAYHGVQKGVYYKGELVDTETVYSDQLMMFLMQGTNAKYKRKQEITGADGGAFLMLAKLDDDGLDDLIEQKMRELKETPDA